MQQNLLKQFYGLKKITAELICIVILCTAMQQLQAQTNTYSYTGSVQTYTVPAGVTSLQVKVYGAQGSNATTGGTGGKGAFVQANITVTPGDILSIYVGGANGYNGGGNAGNGGAGNGGGASDIRLNGTSLSNRIIVAGGGGGGGENGYDAGAGGGSKGGNGGNSNTAGQNGTRFTDQPSQTASGGYGGTVGTGGAKALGCGSFTGTDGLSNGTGGNGQTCCGDFVHINNPGGGGGGGGYVTGGGGGGGSAGTTVCSSNSKGGGGGGAGGSNYTVGSATFVTLTDGVQSGNGWVQIIVLSPTITVTGTLSAYAACAGTASAEQSFSVSGSLLTAGITITAPAGFEITTTSGSGYSSSVTLTQAGGTVSATTIYARLTNTASGTIADSIRFASTGATTQALAAAGTVITVQPPVITGSTVCKGSNLSATFTGNADSLVWQNAGVLIKTNTPGYAANGVTVAGGNGSGAVANQLSFPMGIYVDASGNIYVADANNNRIQKWTVGATSGVTVAGGNGVGSAANQLTAPYGVSVDASGNMYVVDNGNNRIQKWAAGATSGITVAGGNGAGSAANQFDFPTSVYVNASGDIYVTDYSNNRIQKWAAGATSGVTVAGGNGSGSTANQLNGPLSVYADASGNIYVDDNGNNRIQKWAAGATSGVTVAGGNGSGSAANQLAYSYGLSVDGSANIYVTDYRNNRIQKWAAGAISGVTVAGGNGFGSAANQLSRPTGVYVDASGNIYAADVNNNRVQKFSPVAVSSPDTLNNAAAGSYTVTAYNAGCTATSAAYTVNVSPTVPAITGVTDECLNSTTTFANTTPGGVWSSNNTASATVDANGVVSGVANGSAIISYSVTGNNCTTTVTKSIVINQLPSITPTTVLNNLSSICVGKTTTLIGGNISFGINNPVIKAVTFGVMPVAATTGNITSNPIVMSPNNYAYTKQWSSDNTTVATIDPATGIVSGITAGLANIKYFVTNTTTGCSNSVSTPITVNALPVVPAIAGNNANVLVGSTNTLADALTGGVWSSDNTAVATVNATTGVVSGISAGKANIIYTVTNSNGCSSSASTAVTVVAIAPITGTTTVCAKSTTALADVTPGGVWSSSNVTIAVIDVNGNVTGVSAGTATISYTIAGSGAVTTTITVNALPNSSITAANGTIICGAGGSIILTGSGGDSYTWSRNGVSISGTTNANLTATSPGVYTATTTITATGCSAAAGNSITVTQLFAPTAAFTTTNYCTNLPVQLTNQSVVTNSGPVNFNWTDNNGNSSTNSNTSFIYPNTGTYNIKLTVTPQACPSIANSISKSVTIEAPMPAVRLTTVQAMINNPTQLSARNFGTTYQWTPAAGLSDASIANPTVKISKEQDYQIKIIAASGCITVDSLLVEVFDNSVYVPNIFSPNGDGHNDILYVNLINVKQLKTYRIYDRWGKKLFETSDMSQGWDGKTNGILQHIDTYIWVVEAVDNSGRYITKQGNVTLIR